MVEAPTIPADSGILRLAAGWIALCYSLAIAGFLFWGAFQESDGAMLLMSLILIPWLAAPVVFAGALVCASASRLGAAIFLVVEVGMIASVALLIVDFTYINRSSTGGIALLFWPLPQLAALVIVGLIASAFGWRERPDFARN